jgi:hypothetical protein
LGTDAAWLINNYEIKYGKVRVDSIDSDYEQRIWEKKGIVIVLTVTLLGRF